MWFRLEHSFGRHPKLLALTPTERWVWIGTLCWAAEYAQASGVIAPAADNAIPGLKKLRAKLRALALLDARDGVDEVHDWYLYTSASIAEKVRWFLERNPDATANDVVRQVGGTRQIVLEEVKKLRPDTTDTGSDDGSTEPLTPGSDSGSTEPCKVVRKVVHAGARNVTTRTIEVSKETSLAAAPPATRQKRAVRKPVGPPGEHEEVVALLTEIFGYTPSNDTAWGPFNRWAKSIHQALIATGLPKEGWKEEIRRRARVLFVRFDRKKERVTVKSLADHWDTVDAAPAFTEYSPADYPAWVSEVPEYVASIVREFPGSQVWSSRPGFLSDEVLESEPLDAVYLRNRLREFAERTAA